MLNVDRQEAASRRTVALMLNGGRVTAQFREALFDETAREGISINEFVIRAAAEKLRASGRQVTGVFRLGDLDTQTG